MPIDMDGRCEFADALLVQLRDELLQFVACTFEVLALIRIHVCRTASAIGEPSDSGDKGVRITRVHHFQMHTTDG